MMGCLKLQQSDSSVDKDNEDDESFKKEGSVSDVEDAESDDEDDAEAEYLNDFVQTKKLQVICYTR